MCCTHTVKCTVCTFRIFNIVHISRQCSLTSFIFLIKVNAADASLSRISSGGATHLQDDERANTMTTAGSETSKNLELEAALSSLHLRDLRCQQLSLEITKVRKLTV